MRTFIILLIAFYICLLQIYVRTCMYMNVHKYNASIYNVSPFIKPLERKCNISQTMHNDNTGIISATRSCDTKIQKYKKIVQR